MSMTQITLPEHPFPSGLYCVATPIGNLADITLRGLACLTAADAIYAEDTRQTRKLLDAYGIRAKELHTYHEHSAQNVRDHMIDKVQQGHVIALVSDSGLPLISDPGYRLVSTCREKGLDVYTIPGANAALTALVSSGMATDQFSFIGFLPTKDKARRHRLTQIKNGHAGVGVIIAYESPTRVLKTLGASVDILGDTWPICLARELTKKFEQVTTLSAKELYHWAKNHSALKGEMVLLFAAPPEKSEPDDDMLTAEIQALLADGKTVRDCVEAVLITFPELKRRQVYQMAQELHDQNSRS